MAIVLQEDGRNQNMSQRGILWAGTSGLVLEEPNKQAYPLAFRNKNRLTYYGSKFNSIEINSSFYKIPRCSLYRSWLQMVPADFKFTVKLWRGITHEKEYEQKDLAAFMEAINCFDDKKGCLLIQFPATAPILFERIDQLIGSIRKLDKDMSWRIAVEFRHLNWYHPDMLAMLDHHDASLVLHDMPKSLPPALNSMAPFIYLRFHGEKGDYRGSYEEKILKIKANQIRNWLDEGRDVYAYFNNTIGAAAANLKMLKAIVDG